jgi:hypothetical protein
MAWPTMSDEPDHVDRLNRIHNRLLTVPHKRWNDLDLSVDDRLAVLEKELDVAMTLLKTLYAAVLELFPVELRDQMLDTIELSALDMLEHSHDEN